METLSYSEHSQLNQYKVFDSYSLWVGALQSERCGLIALSQSTSLVLGDAVMATRSDVFAGPNKNDLMLSLFEGKEVTFTRQVLLNGKYENKKEQAVITGLKVSDPRYGLMKGSDICRFEIEGTFIEQIPRLDGINRFEFKGFYETQARTGRFTLTDYDQVQRVTHYQDDEEDEVDLQEDCNEDIYPRNHA